jgi:carbonic anhydrase
VSVVDEVLSANQEYVASFGEKGSLALPPARGFAILTCMDARLDPAKYAGLSEGDAHVIRNAGGLVTDDALRSLVISHWELGTQEAVVIGHTGCGMTLFTDDTLRRKLVSLGVDASASEIDFLAFRDLEESIRASVQRVMESPLLPEPYVAYGFVYDVASGHLHEVA